MDGSALLWTRLEGRLSGRRKPSRRFSRRVLLLGRTSHERCCRISAIFI